MDPIIEIEHLSKKYKYGETKPYYTLRDTLTGLASVPFQLFRKSRRQDFLKKDEFWALKDINFKVNPGEAIGIIGPNGAGKSTLLKILSRITPPTDGRVVLRGRVGSLLEIGTGFHQELTGRENIYLNGAILGMTRYEIDKKFDEIVGFSGIEKFLDTPVKRYSSGMYTRLAFSVAANLESEILLVDEVLAVGDAEFQKKCLGKMNDVTQKEGRTVLFVSHNMNSIRQLCSKAIWLKEGKIQSHGDARATINKYLADTGSKVLSPNSLKEIISKLPKDPSFALLDIKMVQNNKVVWGEVDGGEDFQINVRYKIREKTIGFRLYLDLCDAGDDLILRSFHDENLSGEIRNQKGEYLSTVIIPKNTLGPIKYKIYVQAGIHAVRYCIPPDSICVPISVIANRSYSQYPTGEFVGKVGPLLKWQTDEVRKTK